jgi:hypothetical protein
LLCNPQTPLNLATTTTILTLGAATLFVARHLERISLGENGVL